MSTFSIVYAQNLHKFGGRDFVTALEIAQILKLGITQNAVTVSISKGKFPLPTTKVLGVQMVSLVHYALYCLNPDTDFSHRNNVLPESGTPSPPAPRRRGRPRNVLQQEGEAA